jgi:hypothetical protein
VCDPVICADRQDIISRFALGLSNQETPILSLFKYQLLRLLARKVTMEPPVKHKHKYFVKVQGDEDPSYHWSGYVLDVVDCTV